MLWTRRSTATSPGSWEFKSPFSSPSSAPSSGRISDSHPKRLVPRHEPLQLFSPVLNDDETRWRTRLPILSASRFDHEKATAIRRNVVRPSLSGRSCAVVVEVAAGEQLRRISSSPRWSRLDTHAHHRRVGGDGARSRQIEQFLTVTTKDRPRASTARHLPAPAGDLGERPHVYFPLSRFVGFV